MRVQVAKRFPTRFLLRYPFPRRPQAPRALVIYVPVTTQNRHSRYQVELGDLKFLKEMSVANVQGIGLVPPEALGRIKQTIRFALEL